MSLSSFNITSVSNRYTVIYLLHQYQIPKYISAGKCWCPVSKTRATIILSSKDNNTYGTSDDHSKIAGDHSRTTDERGLTGKEEEGHEESLTSTEILKKLQRYGLSGILSYGLLNTVYYTTAFLLVWFYISPAPEKMGFRAAAERFLKMMAVVWAGSQVTKLFRAGGVQYIILSRVGIPHFFTRRKAYSLTIKSSLQYFIMEVLPFSTYNLVSSTIAHGALALAPFVDRGLSWFTVRYKFKSQGKAFLTIVGLCLGLAVVLFLAVTLLSA